MPLRDLILHIDTYPDPTSSEAIDQAVRFAGVMGGTLSAVAVEAIIEAPNNRLANYLIGLNKIAQQEEQKSRDYCISTLAEFNSKASSAGVLGESIQVRSHLYDVGTSVAYQSRTRDACLVPVMDQYDGQRAVIEAVVFGAGRPVLTYRPGTSDLPGDTPDLVVLAWDGTRTAARAMADSLPLLQKARKVRVLTVTGEKPSATSGLGKGAQRHLAGHGVNAVVDEIDAGGKAIGPVIDGYLERLKPHLLVMGAYGHSRAREFILGGATEHMLKNPPVPLMLSH